jgi:hypothetical protein
VLAQRVALRPLAEQVPRFLSIQGVSPFGRQVSGLRLLGRLANRPRRSYL